MTTDIAVLSESLVDELVGAVGLPKTAFWHNLVWTFTHKITSRLASLGVTFDRIIADRGLPEGSRWALTHFCHPITARGSENIPATGPLLIVSNHPGTYDALVIFSRFIRRDIHWIGSEIPFLEKLPNLHGHIYFTSRSNAMNRMAVTRAAIRHLRSGGTLLYFGAGHREPDPAVYPDAGKMMDNWLPGIDFFIKHVPGVRLLPTVVSGVVSAKWSRHPITLLRRKQIDKQRLSEFGQVITQLLAPGRLMLSPFISFGGALTASELQERYRCDLLPAIIALEKALLIEHCQQFGGTPGL